MPTRVANCPGPARLTGRRWTILKGGNRDGVRRRSAEAMRYGDLSACGGGRSDVAVSMLLANSVDARRNGTTRRCWAAVMRVSRALGLACAHGCSGPHG